MFVLYAFAIEYLSYHAEMNEQPEQRPLAEQAAEENKAINEQSEAEIQIVMENAVLHDKVIRAKRLSKA